MRKVISVSAESNNRLYIEFDTGEVRNIDVSPYYGFLVRKTCRSQIFWQCSAVRRHGF